MENLQTTTETTDGADLRMSRQSPTRGSPPPGYMSQSSDQSKECGNDFADKSCDEHRMSRQRPTRGSAPPDYMSLRSNQSKDWGVLFKSCDPRSENLNFPTGHELDLDTTFKRLEEDVLTFVREQLKRFHWILATDYPECLESKEDEEQSSREAFLKITLDFLRRMKQEQLAERLHSMFDLGLFHDKLKKRLQQRVSCVSEGISKVGNPTPLDQIYTELYITEGGATGVNQEHEVRHIESFSRKTAAPETIITCEDIFKGPAHRQRPIRTVMTMGVAGIGKTFLTQKFTLDWAEGRANQDIQLLFPFTFRELSVLRDRQFSLVGLLHHFFSESAGFSFEHLRVVFIFDGLDECRLPLDFNQTRVLTEATECASVDVLLVNLIRGSLLPSARLWITTRPAAANQIPAQYVSMVTEVRGFTDPQKEQYFMKRFSDEANTIIAQIKASRSLHIMCHIPIFCWIFSIVIQKIMENTEQLVLPKTLTNLYIHFLVVQAKVKNSKCDGHSETDPPWTPDTREMVESLGKLAFEQLQKGNLIFYESDLNECGLDATKASNYSGVFTQVFREESGLYQDKVYCFIHLSVQEFLAALHVHLTFFNSGVNLLSTEQTSESPESEVAFYRSAVDQALQSPNGHLDLFLRFLLGLSLPTNQSLLRGLLSQTGRAQTKQDTVQYIKEKINNGPFAERSIYLFHCLNELNDQTLVKGIQQSMREGCLNPKQLSPYDWSAVAFLLLTTNKDLEEFDLKQYCASEEVLRRLLPVIKESKKAVLSHCNLSQSSCGSLSSVLSSTSLRHLDLSNNNLQDSGVELLCSELKSAPCRLETLSLSSCNLSLRSCECLLSVLTSQSSSLRHLDLSNNNLQDSGVELLCSGLKNAPCSLETLSLSYCALSQSSSGPLSSVLTSSSLRHLHLSNNALQDSGVELLCSGLKNPDCSLLTLSLSSCNLSQSSCGPLSSVLSSSSLRHLDLSNNNLQDAGVELLFSKLKSAPCRMETLSLSCCNLSQSSCGPLSSVLSSSSLRHLDLSNNDLQDSGVEQLCSGLKSAPCRLETLRLSGCLVSERGGASLASALSSAPFHLRELDLSYNHPGPSAELLTVQQDNPRDILRLDPAGEQWMTPSLRKYLCEFSLDSNTVNRELHLLDTQTVRHVEHEDPYSDHRDRFDSCPQVLSSTGLTGRCYWEVDWSGCEVCIAMSYKMISRKEDQGECMFGYNDWSWSLRISDGRYSFRHSGIKKGRDFVCCQSSPQFSGRVAVFLDSEAGSLCFYEVLSDGKLLHLHTFISTFTEPLFPGFGLWRGSSVSLVNHTAAPGEK